MSLPEPLTTGGPWRAAEAATLYWVVGGCYGDDSRSWRRWSEVLGPFGRREAAEAERRKLLGIFAGDGRVHFEVVMGDPRD